MIEPTAIIQGLSDIHQNSYIGHYAIIGAPLALGVFGQEETDQYWAESTGVSIGEGVVVGSHTIIDDGTKIQKGVWIGAGVRIGHDVVIEEHARLYYRCQIYDRVLIGEGAEIGGFVCNDSQIGERAIVLGSLVHRFVDAQYGIPEEAPIVEREAFIGTGAIVIGGVRIEQGAYIAAGSVLAMDAEAECLYAGAPAQKIGRAPKALIDRTPSLVDPLIDPGIS